jgi:hypothetical protein
MWSLIRVATSTERSLMSNRWCLTLLVIYVGRDGAWEETALVYEAPLFEGVKMRVQ